MRVYQTLGRTRSSPATSTCSPCRLVGVSASLLWDALLPRSSAPTPAGPSSPVEAPERVPRSSSSPSSCAASTPSSAPLFPMRNPYIKVVRDNLMRPALHGAPERPPYRCPRAVGGVDHRPGRRDGRRARRAGRPDRRRRIPSRTCGPRSSRPRSPPTTSPTASCWRPPSRPGRDSCRSSRPTSTSASPSGGGAARRVPGSASARRPTSAGCDVGLRRKAGAVKRRVLRRS